MTDKRIYGKRILLIFAREKNSIINVAIFLNYCIPSRSDCLNECIIGKMKVLFLHQKVGARIGGFVNETLNYAFPPGSK